MIPDLVGIGNIGIGNVGVGDVSINPPNVRDVLYIAETNHDWMVNPPSSIPPAVPVTVDIGTPVVDIPGCVETHKENLERPPNKNESLVNDDPRQSVVLCDAGMPAYAPMDYDARRLKIEEVTPPKKEEEYKHRGNYNGDGVPDGPSDPGPGPR